MGERASERCRQLKRLTVPSTVAVLGQYSFLDCWALGKVLFAPDALLVELEEGVFVNWRFRLRSIPGIFLPSA
jgi:hypothetical protein